MRRVIAFIGAVLLVCGCTTPPSAGQGTSIDARVPRTDRPFHNDPNNFQFVIVGDRTGGRRPGVFKHAMEQVNWLQPEFVLSVGDLIEGYSDDENQLEREWDEVDAMIDTLQMPFFYTVGNHDIGNEVMRDVWHERYGPDYYHFRYRDVLFVSLNTEDPPFALPAPVLARQVEIAQMMDSEPEKTQEMIIDRRPSGPPELPEQPAAISDAQLRFIETALRENADVRWTVVLMHKPAWTHEGTQFQRIEALLADRPYTMIAGHNHYYDYGQRHGRDHIVMATTGGIWLSGGPGSVDHLLWVTMTDEGPIFANIELNGLVETRTSM